MNDLDKKYYKIAEVVELVGEPASTLRFWEKEFPAIVKPRRNTGGTRFYRPADIEALRMIRYLLRDRGLRLEAARAELERNRDGISRRYEVVARLGGVRDRLLKLQEALESRN